MVFTAGPTVQCFACPARLYRRTSPRDGSCCQARRESWREQLASNLDSTSSGNLEKGRSLVISFFNVVSGLDTNKQQWSEPGAIIATSQPVLTSLNIFQQGEEAAGRRTAGRNRTLSRHKQLSTPLRCCKFTALRLNFVKTNCQTLSMEGMKKVEGVQSLRKSVKSRRRWWGRCRPSQPSRPFPRECQTWKRSGREVR